MIKNARLKLQSKKVLIQDTHTHVLAHNNNHNRSHCCFRGFAVSSQDL